MQMAGSAELPLLTELLTTVSQVGAEATLRALSNARSKGIDIEDPVIKQVTDTALQEVGISFDQLIAKRTRTLKKQHGLIIVSYCLTMLKYSQVNIGAILGGRSRSQINRYHSTMKMAKAGRIYQLRVKFDILIDSLKKTKQHEQRTKSTSGTRRKK